MRFDLHTHTVFSYQGDVSDRESDSSIQMEDLPYLIRTSGLDGLVLTDHMTMEAGNDEFRRVKEANHDVVMLRGMEYHSDHSHLLLFGIDDDEVCRRFGMYGPAQEVIDFVNSQGGVVVPAHPYQKNYTHNLGDKVFNLNGLTALETINGALPEQLNVKAQIAAMVMRLPGTGGSDAHWNGKVGQVYTEFSNPVHSMDDLVRELKDGNYSAMNSKRKISVRVAGRDESKNVAFASTIIQFPVKKK